MAKYLFHGTYSQEGLKGLLKDGGSKRRQAVEKLMESLGGSLEAYYFAFGGEDFYCIADLPANTAAAAGSLVVASTGTVKPKTVVLLTPEEIDEVVKKTVTYRPPGG
jgi:uncharacterized protein with GYD domain